VNIPLTVLADRYLASPSPKKEEEMLVMLEPVIQQKILTLIGNEHEAEDLHIIASLGASKAIRTWKKEEGAFFRWCMICIYRAIGDYLRTNGVLIRTPRSLKGIMQIEYVPFDTIVEFLEGKDSTLCRTEQERQLLLATFSCE
jgi:DNA-directed RNA polymerase specialized sigma subunit